MNLHLTTIETTEANSLSGKIKAALTRAVVGHGKLSPEVFAIEGMSGKKYRLFINNLVESMEGASYLGNRRLARINTLRSDIQEQSSSTGNRQLESIRRPR